jgi:hypothetical protein
MKKVHLFICLVIIIFSLVGSGVFIGDLNRQLWTLEKKILPMDKAGIDSRIPFPSLFYDFGKEIGRMFKARLETKIKSAEEKNGKDSVIAGTLYKPIYKCDARTGFYYVEYENMHCQVPISLDTNSVIKN